jgi:hypothetical protein
MPKLHPKTQKKRVNCKSNVKVEPISITKSKFYWLGLTTVTVIALLTIGVTFGFAIQQIALILLTVLLVLVFAWYLRVKQSILGLKTRATYIFVGAAFLGFGVWAVIVIGLAATGIGVQLSSLLGDQLFIIASQIIFIVMGGFIGEYLSTNGSFQAFAEKVHKKFG